MVIIMNVPAGKFKAQCLKLMDQVGAGGEEIVITKHGKPVAKLVAVTKEKKKSGFGCLKGSVTYCGDIVAPIDVEWDAEKGILLNE